MYCPFYYYEVSQLSPVIFLVTKSVLFYKHLIFVMLTIYMEYMLCSFFTCSLFMSLYLKCIFC